MQWEEARLLNNPETSIRPSQSVIAGFCRIHVLYIRNIAMSCKDEIEDERRASGSDE